MVDVLVDSRRRRLMSRLKRGCCGDVWQQLHERFFPETQQRGLQLQQVVEAAGAVA